MTKAEAVAIRIAARIGAASTAGATALLAYPHDAIPQIIIIGLATVGVVAMAFAGFKGSPE